MLVCMLSDISLNLDLWWGFNDGTFGNIKLHVCPCKETSNFEDVDLKVWEVL
jgi:hypothetical protein